MLYRIADFYIDIECIFSSTLPFLADYACDEAREADFCIKITEEDIEKEKKASEEFSNDVFDARYLERTAIIRKICGELLPRGAFLMHGALIEYEGVGYMFTAKSGVGKTTHIRLWQKCFGGENVTIVNGDKPILRVFDDGIYAYGTPWCGKEKYNKNTRVKLKNLCFVERAEENSIAPIPEADGVTRIFSQVMVADSADLATQLMLVDKLVENVDMYLLRCNKNADAAKVAYNGMK
ncbi:MAG: hypothetical protein IJ002_08710 [Clostridia bacterium]|nr:hypothetical protein [Clostridia bacterium]